jgi:N-methylhydantoinase B/oxoprolinase/acetone carboxylase alpha subunit
MIRRAPSWWADGPAADNLSELRAQVAREREPAPLTATDHYDDGTVVRLTITVNTDDGSALYYFAGTGPQVWGNYNCPVSITHFAMIYTIRSVIDADTPLSMGCLLLMRIAVPAGSVLRPVPAVKFRKTVERESGSGNWGQREEGQCRLPTSAPLVCN